MEKNIVVGVSGGIAAYKACDVVSKLKKQGFKIDVIMTKNAQEFVSPLTFQTLSNQTVVTDMFETPSDWNVEHIELAKKADVFVIVPATANIIGKIANGIADDMITTTIMATEAKKVIVPAMNTKMYHNPIVQENILKLKRHGYYFIEPVSGLLACGDTGKGKMEDPTVIVEELCLIANQTKEMAGCKVTVTAGATTEDIDPVRYLTNRSTGKMGYAIAEQAILKGATVVLISGKTNLKPPRGLSKFIEVRSAEEMYQEVKREFFDTDILIKAAAVADFTPKVFAKNKIKKQDENLVIDLKRTKDIAFEMGQLKKSNQVMVGFAAETESVLEHAVQKLKKKNLDFIVSNDLTKSGAGFGTDTNIVNFLFPDGEIEKYDLMQKKEVADRILEKAHTILQNRK
ncbi:phosphopantothenoylcysteine decarboxylase/phosphopantothenate--cysteine ligase [Filifactor alocis ATCC 35896]|uniref:Coenzyme A biosynthesis bifunctional protein CoaBC n=2 Tax=Filifactor TaxID=44259 RepID=D6GR59_FILAD|nr:bifunctional phosphopantothenoylcysteine decarboxylase/phosphopantothenate--cysteine ligase CoaBC [Filifactor alocis]EFE28150.1 phosphopantothenoylcysteine decarboxylase/phosphopantothenate--cysteine ligase [Filifactor alocis ATCC 35896]